MSFIGKIRNALSRSNRIHVGGFSVGGSKTVDQLPPKPKPTEADIQKEHDNARANEAERKTLKRLGFKDSGNNNNNGGGGSGGGTNPDKNDFLKRRFNYERHATFPWLSENQYEFNNAGRRNVPWGRIFSVHAILEMFPRNKQQDIYDMGRNEEARGIPPRVVEHAIAYGEKKAYGDPEEGHNRVYQGVVVGVTKDEKIVRNVMYVERLDKK